MNPPPPPSLPPDNRPHPGLPPSWEPARALEEVRFVALDTETTGLNPARDQIISIGAVAVRAGEIDLADSFEVLMPIDYNSPTVVFHGITREETRQGVPPDRALGDFREYLANGVLVGLHLRQDLAMLDRALLRHGYPPLSLPALDLLDLVHRLADAGQWRRPGPPRSLDDLCGSLQIPPHDRHTAAGDAFLAAQIFLHLLPLARQTGWTRLGALLGHPT